MIKFQFTFITVSPIIFLLEFLEFNELCIRNFNLSCPPAFPHFLLSSWHSPFFSPPLGLLLIFESFIQILYFALKYSGFFPLPKSDLIIPSSDTCLSIKTVFNTGWNSSQLMLPRRFWIPSWSRIACYSIAWNLVLYESLSLGPETANRRGEDNLGIF